jgi:DNA invertase Pin-like site-specific DNA recombinase
VVETYRDAGISGAKGRDKRPGFDAMLKDAGRRKFDVVMAWAIDRLGRSLIDLLGTIEHLEAVGVDLYLDQQSIDTTTPAGKLLFQLTGAFAEFERSMIRQRVRAGLIKVKLARDGKFISKKGNVRTKEARAPWCRTQQDGAGTAQTRKGHRYREGGKRSGPRGRHGSPAQAQIEAHAAG